MSITKEITKIIEYQNSTLLLKDKENKTYPPNNPPFPKNQISPSPKLGDIWLLGKDYWAANTIYISLQLIDWV